MSPEGAFAGDAENVIRWVRVVGIGLALGGIAVLAVAFARGRAWRATAPAKWMALVGLLVIPISSMLLGNVVGFHRAKQSCRDCHTMDPWVADMEDPKSTSLAAKHYRNRWINEDQCYTCHKGYGMLGTLKAKLGGASHVLHEYVLGIPETIRIREPFPQATCLHCHADAASYREVDIHIDAEVAPLIERGELSCFECHDPPHPRRKKK